MPWKVRSLREARKHFVEQALRSTHSIAQLCREFGISTKTGFKWLSRFRTGGGAALHDQSRRPKRSPDCTADRWLKAISQVRQRHPRWGAKKIYARLRKEHPRVRLPKVRTISKWLPRLGPVRRARARSRSGPQLNRPPLTKARAANHVWTIDFKGYFRTRDGQRVDPLTVRDLFSRYLLGIRLLSHRHEPVQQYLRQLFRRYGLPKVIRVDHGSPFAGDGALDLSRLSAWWIRLGIGVEFTGRGRPQDNGAHEQMHRVYKAEVATPPAATPCAQQQRTTRWVGYYNYERPHEALEQKTPASYFRKSPRPYRPPLGHLEYPRTWLQRRADSRGCIHWQGRRRIIGRAFQRESLGVKTGSDGTHTVYFGQLLIGVLVDTDQGGMRPVQWSKTKIIDHQPSPMSMH